MDLSKKVVDASNELKLSLARNPQIATNGAAQPAALRDVEACVTEVASAASEPASTSHDPQQQRKRDRGLDREPPQPTAKVEPSRQQQKRKEKPPKAVPEASDASSAAQPAVAHSKTRRLTQYFAPKAGPTPATELETMAQGASTISSGDAKHCAERQREMQKLYYELRPYRDSNPNARDIELRIEQCKLLQQLPLHYYTYPSNLCTVRHAMVFANVA